MTTIRDDEYPNLVVHFYANTTRGHHSETIESYVKEVGIEFDRFVIRKILRMGFGGEIY